MGFRQSDKYELWRIKNFFDQLARECRKQDVYELTSFDAIASDTLGIILNECHDSRSETISMSSYQLSRRTNSTRRRIRRRLEELARYGLVKLRSEWRNDGSNKRKPMQITPHPWLFQLLTVGAKPAHKNQAVKHFVAIGISRLDYDEPVQGFKVDCPVGDIEPEQQEQPDREQTENQINELIEREKAAHARKLKEQEEWRRDGDRFVEACATIWTRAQAKSGNGSARPNWSGDKRHMPPAASKERLELIKVFQQYGGRVGALTWYIFACGLPAIDENTGKRVYNPRIPHRQFITTDKRPSHYAKYFNAILQDRYFLQFAKKEWAETEPQLREYYQDVLDKQPRDGAKDTDKIGFTFGDTAPTLEEVTA